MEQRFPKCCLVECGRIIRSNERKYKISQPSIKSILVRSIGNDMNRFTDGDAICAKCHLNIRNRWKIKLPSGKWIYEKATMLPCDEPSITIDHSTLRPRQSNDYQNKSQTSTESIPRDNQIECLDMQFMEETISTSNCMIPFIGSENQNNSASQSSITSMTRWLRPNSILDENVPVLLPGISSLKSTESICCICSSKVNRSRIPKSAIVDCWIKCRVYIPSMNRCCKTHLRNGVFTEEALHIMRSSNTNASMTGMQMASWMHMITDNLTAKQRPLDFDLSSGLTDEDYLMLLGISAANFDSLAKCIKGKVISSRNR